MKVFDEIWRFLPTLSGSSTSHVVELFFVVDNASSADSVGVDSVAVRVTMAVKRPMECFGKETRLRCM